MVAVKRKKSKARQEVWTPYDALLKEWLNAHLPGRALIGSSRPNKRGLGEKLGMPASAITRLLKGERRIAAAELPIIECYLGVVAPTHPAKVRHPLNEAPRRFSIRRREAR